MIGQRIKWLRRSANDSQQDLADYLGTSQRSVSHWEVNRTTPDAITISRIADKYETTTDYIIGRTDDPSPILKHTPISEAITDIAAHSNEPMTREDVEALVKNELINIKKELESIRKELQ